MSPITVNVSGSGQISDPQQGQVIQCTMRQLCLCYNDRLPDLTTVITLLYNNPNINSVVMEMF